MAIRKRSRQYLAGRTSRIEKGNFEIMVESTAPWLGLVNLIGTSLGGRFIRGNWHRCFRRSSGSTKTSCLTRKQLQVIETDGQHKNPQTEPICAILHTARLLGRIGDIVLVIGLIKPIGFTKGCEFTRLGSHKRLVFQDDSGT